MRAAASLAASAVSSLIGLAVTGEIDAMLTQWAWEEAAENHAAAEGTWCPHVVRRARVARILERYDAAMANHAAAEGAVA